MTDKDDARGLRAIGITRMFDNNKALLLCLNREPTNDEMRNIHDLINAHLAAPAPVTKKLNLAECATAVLDGFLGDCFPGDLPMIEAMRRQLQNLEDSLTERQLPPLPREQK